MIYFDIYLYLTCHIFLFKFMILAFVSMPLFSPIFPFFSAFHFCKTLTLQQITTFSLSVKIKLEKKCKVLWTWHSKYSLNICCYFYNHLGNGCEKRLYPKPLSLAHPSFRNTYLLFLIMSTFLFPIFSFSLDLPYIFQ